MNLLFRLIQLFLLLLPFQVAVSPVSGVDLPFSRVFALILFFSFLSLGLFRRNLRISLSGESFFLYSFLFFSILSILWAENSIWAIRRSTFLLTFIPLFSVYSFFLKEVPNAASRLLRSFVIGAGFSGFIGVLEFLSQYILGVPVVFRFWTGTILPIFLGESFSSSVSAYPSLLVNIGGATILRASSFFPDPHMAAFYMGLAFPVSIYFCLFEGNARMKAYFGILSIFIFSADLLTFSRGGYFGLMIGALLFFLRWVVFGKKMKEKLLLFFGLISVLLGIFIFAAPIRERLSSAFSLEEGSNLGRMEMYSEAIRNISRQPQGYGLGNYPLAVKPTAGFREPIYAHDLFLDIATESGIPGMICFLLVFMIVFARLIRFRKGIFFVGAISLGIFFGHALFETPLYSVHILPVFLLFLALPSGIPLPIPPRRLSE